MNHQIPKSVHQLFQLLQLRLSGQCSEPIHFSKEEWHDVFKLAARQGVLGVVGDVLNTLDEASRPPKGLMIQWILAMEKRTDHYNQMLKRSAEFAQMLAKRDVKCVVLKGLALAAYYPNPTQREFGDFDCYLCGRYAEGNQLAKDCGAEMVEDDYKHSHIHYKGMTIENHQFLINFIGCKCGKEMEEAFESLAKLNVIGKLGNTELLIPNDDFMAMFTIFHAQHHFLTEGVKLRFLVDWACFLNARQEMVDWKCVTGWMRNYKMYNFAAMMTSICVKYFGTQIYAENVPLIDDSETEVLFIEDIFSAKTIVLDKNLLKKLQRIYHKFKRMHKFKKLMYNSLIREVFITILFNSYIQRLRCVRSVIK